ncbi:MAG TPA: hypothetical protein VGC00_05740 [Thermoanaerobaculia bacterium]
MGGLPARGDEDLRRLRAVELETELARQRAIYFVLDPDARRLTVKVRATELETVRLLEIRRLVFAPIFGSATPPELPAPAVWTVVEGPGDTDRETIAPTTLRPYSEADEEEEPPATATPGAPAKPGGEVAGKPTTYRVRLDVGWQLLVTSEPPRLGFAQRFAAAVRDGWQRLRGEEPSHPPLIALVVAPDDARRLHHIFRTGTRILVLTAD